MPGPSNKQNKQRRKSSQTKPNTKAPRTSIASSTDDTQSPNPPPKPSPKSATPIIIDNTPVKVSESLEHHNFHELHDEPQIFPRPFMEDPGNGPRVRDTSAFLESYFAHAPSDDPLCAEFGQIEILEMLKTILPHEVAVVLWYNKSRSLSRICPVCQRLYTLGQDLKNHTISDDIPLLFVKSDHPQLIREQTLSGLCSPICFLYASFVEPDVLKRTWGYTAEEMDAETWKSLNASGSDQKSKPALVLLVRMTRLSDLGLAQLCLPDVDIDEEGLSVQEGI